MMVKRNMPVYLTRWDWMLVFIFTFIIRRRIPARYVPALKRKRKSQKKQQSKRAQRKVQEDNYKLVKWSVYSAGLGLTIFSKFY